MTSTCSPLDNIDAISWTVTRSGVSQERLLRNRWLSLRILYLPKCAITLVWMTCSSNLQVMEVRDTVQSMFLSSLMGSVHCRERDGTVVIG